MLSLLVLALAEVVLVCWCYGIHNWINNLQVQSDKTFHILFNPVIFQKMGVHVSYSSWYWKLTLKFCAPILIICIVLLTITNITPCYYGDYVYPDYIQVRIALYPLLMQQLYIWPLSHACGWAMTPLPFLPIPLCLLLQTCHPLPLVYWIPVGGQGNMVEAI